MRIQPEHLSADWALLGVLYGNSDCAAGSLNIYTYIYIYINIAAALTLYPFLSAFGF